MKRIISKSFEETRKLGEKLARDFGGGIICLEGDLGSGKTTFAQGFLRGLGAKGPYTSPTFVIMKEYKLEISNSKFPISNKVKKAYHLDAYRVGEEDVLNLGWEEVINNPENVVIVEWPERIEKVIPASAKRIEFKWLGENEREIQMNF